MTAFDDLGLTPHPEGGAFRELHRSPARVMTPRGERSALTVIHFRLVRGERSKLHRVAAEELWQFAGGDPLELRWIGAVGALERRVIAAHGAGPQSSTFAVVPAGCWQCARSLGDASLVTCAVAPGFEFTDFELLRDAAAAERSAIELHPELLEFV